MNAGLPASSAPKASLRSRLALWFAGLSLLTLLSAGIYVGRIATGQMQQASGDALLGTARAAAILLADQLHERQLEITLLSQAPHFTRGDLDAPALLRSMEQRARAHAEYAWMGVADAEGKVRQAVGELLVKQSVGSRPWFQEALKGPYTGDLHEAVLLAKLLPGSATGEPLRFIDFAAPIRDEHGTLIGVLGAHAHWSWVTGLVESTVALQDMQREAEVLIVNARGEVLYPERLIGTRYQGDLAAGAGSWSDGGDYLTRAMPVGMRRAPGLGWSIAVRQPLAVALASAHDLRDRLLLLGVLAAAVFGAVAYRLAQRVSRPIEQLAQAAQQLRAGAQGFPIPRDQAVREIAQLSQALQEMTRSLLDKERALREANASLELTVQQRTDALTRANEALSRLAVRDGLTGVFNRRRFDERLAECQQLFLRDCEPYALLIIDADHFKRVNDDYGHAVGDAALKRLAGLLQQNTRSSDFVARYGGEEFAVLLPEAGGEQGALAVAEKIRAAVAAAEFAEVGGITISVGLALASRLDGDAGALLKRADHALYEAKRAGRNRVVKAPPPVEEAVLRG